MPSSRLISSLLCVAASILIFAPVATHGLNIYVEAKGEQVRNTTAPVKEISSYDKCFFDHVYRNDKVVASYSVIEGGNLDIDVRVLGPDGKVVYESERSKEGTFQFKALQEGVHNLCFDNRMSTISGKGISFNLYVGDALHKHDAASQKNLSPLENSVLKTSEGMMGIKDQITYMKYRENRHAETVDSTNKRVLFWNIAKIGTVIAIVIMQIFSIRGFFEKKRKI